MIKKSGNWGIISYPVPLVAILGLDLVGVAEPVTVPSPKGRRVVNTNGVDALDLPSGRLELINVGAERGGGVGTREDVLVHEETPDEVLVLPGLAQTRDLHVKDTVVLEVVRHLPPEGNHAADTDVLSHLEGGDLVELLVAGDVAVVAAQKLALLLGDTGGAEACVTPGDLLTGESDTGNLGTVVDTGEAGEGSPATADIEQALALLELDLLHDDGELVVLKLLEGLLAVGVRDDTRGVDHAGAQEPGVKVVTAVIGVPHLVLVLRARVEEDVGEEGEQEELEDANGEVKGGPVVAVLEDIEHVALDVDVAGKVHLVEGLHGDLGATGAVLGLVLGVLEGQVVVDGAAGQLDLVVDARAEVGLESPVCDQDGQEEDYDEEDDGLGATTNLPRQEGRQAEDERGQHDIAEVGGTGAVSRERRVVDCGGLV